MTIAPTDTRNDRMGASDAACALGLSPWKSAWELWAEKTRRIESGGGSAATRMGQRLESAVLDVAETELGPLSRGELVFAPGLDFPLASTLDAKVEATGLPVEAKTSGIVGPVYGEWGEPESDVIPACYLVQATVQMVCTEAQLAYVYALLGGRGIVRYRVVRDDVVAATIVERLGAWWERHIVLGEEPERTEPLPLEVVKRLRRRPDKVISLDDAAMIVVADYEAAKAAKTEADKRCEAAQAALLAALGDHEWARLTDGRHLTYLESTRKGYTVAESRCRTLRITKGN